MSALKEPVPSALDTPPIPANAPPLHRAEALQGQAAQAGFVWENSAAAFRKLEEELAEFRVALAQQSPAAQEDELGDVLFCLINCARLIGLDAEAALDKANAKFERRFRGMESDLRQDGHADLRALPAGLFLEYWKRQKNKEK